MSGSANTEALRQRAAALVWTNHNVEIAPGVWTVPHEPPLLDDPRVRCIVRTVREALGGSLAGARVADLGCLEGGIALAFALEGAEVLGIEGRPTNVAKCRLLEECFALPNLAFEQGDVRDFRPERYGHFDAVVAAGLLYHLDQPVEFMREASRCTKRVMVVDTHFAPDNEAGVAALQTMPFFDITWNPLMEAGEVHDAGEIFEGRWWREYAEGLTDEDVERQLWASLNNPRSFWLTRTSIYRLLTTCGFQAVGERLDFLAPGADMGIHLREKSRSVFVGIRTDGDSSEKMLRPEASLKASVGRFRALVRTAGLRRAMKDLAKT